MTVPRLVILYQSRASFQSATGRIRRGELAA
jgi:hypothetical protein